MGYWNYRVIEHEPDKFGRVWFQLHEVFYDEDGNISSWTEEPITFIADAEDGGVDGVKNALKMALDDVKSRVVLRMCDLVVRDDTDPFAKLIEACESAIEDLRPLFSNRSGAARRKLEDAVKEAKEWGEFVEEDAPQT